MTTGTNNNVRHASKPVDFQGDRLAEIKQERVGDGYSYDDAVMAVAWLIDEIERLRSGQQVSDSCHLCGKPTESGFNPHKACMDYEAWQADR